MHIRHLALIAIGVAFAAPSSAAAQSPSASPTNPLWHEQKVKNYLPHMTWPEVEDLLTRTDMVIMPVASLEEHGLQGPIGTDFLNGLERAKLVAQRTDVLVAPILFPGNSPYHMGFPGTITLPAETIQLVFFQAAQSLIRHGFKRFLILNSHGGNQIISRYIADRINQETAGIAVELGEAAAPFEKRSTGGSGDRQFDRHGGVGETSTSLYLTPNLVKLEAARAAALTMPDHLERMLPEVVAGDPTATRIFLAEGLKAAETGKHTSTREMTPTGVWSVRDPKSASAEQGREETETFVSAAVAFIERWKQLRPMTAR
ncbi:MAG: creatininase family protein [Vicinamibacterales bacterium]